MTDTQKGTVSVSRDHMTAWAERLERAASGFPGSVPFLAELRAILAHPPCATPAGGACPGDGVGRCKACPVTDEPQDEAVAVVTSIEEKFEHDELVIRKVGISTTRHGQLALNVDDKLYLRPVAQAVKFPAIDQLSNIIRQVDGNHSLGAGALAEKILDAVARLNGIKP